MVCVPKRKQCTVLASTGLITGALYPLHHCAETRSLRDALKASNARLKQARNSTGLSHKQAELLIQDWQPPQVITDLEGVSKKQLSLVRARGKRPHKQDASIDLQAQTFLQDHPVLSGQPWFEEMRQALLTFEKTVGYNAPSKERAFWSALRTLLAEMMTSTSTDQDSQLKAAWKWFSKHRPRGNHDDPGISAALAASLSISNITTTCKTRGLSKQAVDPSTKPYAVTVSPASTSVFAGCQTVGNLLPPWSLMMTHCTALLHV
jgi:hypothetical protein